MYSDAKRIHLLEKLKATQDDTVWEEVEKLLHAHGAPALPSRFYISLPFTRIEDLQAAAADPNARPLYLDLTGIGDPISAEEGEELDRIIEEGCGRVYPSEWKSPFDDDAS